MFDTACLIRHNRGWLNGSAIHRPRVFQVVAPPNKTMNRSLYVLRYGGLASPF